METSNLVCIPVVKELLNEENYMAWREWIRNYLLGQDLWDVVENLADHSNPVSRRKNAAAIHAIQMSCGPKALPVIMGIPAAKLAWDALTNEYNSSSSRPSISVIAKIVPENNPDNSVNEVSIQKYIPLYKAVCHGDWQAANDFLKEHPEGMTARIDDMGSTALHIAASFEHLHIVEELVKLMSEQDLELKNRVSIIALYRALDTGIVEMAECMIKKNRNLVKIPNEYGLLPITYAVTIGQLEIARYLYSVTPLEELLPEKRYCAMLLIGCFRCASLDLALDLLLRYPSLSLTCDDFTKNLVFALATEPSVFLSGCQLLFWQRWIYNWIKIEPASAVKDIRINITKSNASDGKINKRLNLLHQLIEYIFNFIGMLTLNLKNLIGVERIYQAKLTHVLSLELLRLTCDQIATLVTESQLTDATVFNSTIKAAENGISEFIIGVINSNPTLLYTFDNSGQSIFSIAVRFRQAKVFSLIYGIGSKNTFASYRDHSGNILLHMAGMLGLPTQLNRISGAALQMQRELQWFEEVKHITPLGKRENTNKEGKTARELFTEHHKDLRKQGEDWMKQNATSCTVVAALIVTIMFTASLTVPGGNNPNTGYPTFQDHKLFKLFIMSDVISLFSSATSLLMFLGILTSRYAEDDFLKSLPTKLIIGLSMLFISMATMMITFFAAISVRLPGRLWISIPVILFASVPVSVFGWLQFPLLVEIYSSTYGTSIFDRNMKRWIGVTPKI